jgi:uncharacterized membrane protein
LDIGNEVRALNRKYPTSKTKNPMENRPILKIALTSADKLVETLGWIVLLAIWVLTVTNYPNLPDTIPTHFNASGEADGFGGKATILTLPIVGSVLFIGMTILNKYPHLFNYPIKMTADQALNQYTNATKLVRYLKFSIVVIFGLIVLQTIRKVNGEADGLGEWFLSLTLGLIFIPMGYFIFKSFQINRGEKIK